MAGPLSKTEKMVFVSSDGAAGSRLTGDVATMMAQLGTRSLAHNNNAQHYLLQLHRC
jgi:hypothetical protein